MNDLESALAEVCDDESWRKAMAMWLVHMQQHCPSDWDPHFEVLTTLVECACLEDIEVPARVAMIELQSGYTPTEAA